MEKLQFNRSLGHLFHNINLNMRKKLEADLKEFGFTSSYQFGVLLLLSRQNLSQIEISNATLADKPSTTRMLDRMIKKGLVDKKKDEIDKRKQIVYITDKGKELLSKIMPIVGKHNKNVEDMLDEEELEVLFKILNKINNNI